VTATTLSCGSATATVTTTVYPLPKDPTIIRSNDTLFCYKDPSYVSYQWYVMDTLIAGATDTFLVVNHSQNYNLGVTNSYGCVTSVGTLVILLGNQPVLPKEGMAIFPNPAGKWIILQSSLSGSDKKLSISIMNAIGEVVKQEKRDWEKE